MQQGKVELLSNEEIKRYEDIDMIIEAAKEEGKVGDDVGVSGSGVGLTVSASTIFHIEKADGEVTPDPAGLLDDDVGSATGLDSASAHSYASPSSTTEHSGNTHQSTADWLDKLSDSDFDDDSSTIGLYDVDLDNNETIVTQIEDGQRPVTSAPPLHTLDTDKEAYIEIGASPNVVADAAQSLEASIDVTDNGKDNGTLGHVFFFKGDM